VDVLVFNSAVPGPAVLDRYAREHKAPLALGTLPPCVEVIEGAFWRRAIARHDRRRLLAAVWMALAERLLGEKALSRS
jgi:hypothetical protein